MTQAELLQVLNRTLEQTQKRQTKWKSINKSTLSLSFPRSSLLIIEHQNTQLNRLEYSLAIHNSAGNAIAEISYGTHRDDATRTKLATLFRLAYAIAFQVDETIHDILSGLGSPKT